MSGEKWEPEPGDFGPWSLEPADLTAYVDAIRSWAADLAHGQPRAATAEELARATKAVPQRPAWKMMRLEVDIVHVVPTGDLVMHDVADHAGLESVGDCVCGPAMSISPGHDDSDHPDIWVHQHHAIDGRPLPHLR